MESKKLHLFIIAILVIKVLSAQTASYQKIFDVDMYSVNGLATYNQQGIASPSSDQIVCFSAQVANPGKFDIVMLKLDTFGNMIRNKILTKNPNFHDWTREFVKLDGSYYMTGSSRAFDTSAFSYESAYLLQFDENLDVISQTNFFLPERELFAQSITSTSDKNLLITGSSVYNSNWSFFILKTSPKGNVIWVKQYGFPKGMDASCIRELSNGDIMIAGSYPFALQFIMPVAARFNNDGDLKWAKSYNYATGTFDYQNSALKFIHEFGKDRTMLAGRTDYSGLGYMDSYAMMVNETGDLVWSKTFGEFQNDWGYNYSVSGKNQLVISGSTNSFFNNSSFGFVQYIDTFGTLKASYVFGDTSKQEQLTLSDFREINNEKSLVCGLKTISNKFALYVSAFKESGKGKCPLYPVSFQTYDVSSYPIFDYSISVDTSQKLNTNHDAFHFYEGIDDYILCSEKPSSTEDVSGINQQLKLLPNPALDNIILSFDQDLGEGYLFQLYDLTGRILMNRTMVDQNNIDISSLAPGTFYIKVVIKNIEYNSLLIKIDR